MPTSTCTICLTGGGQSELLEELETIEVEVMNDDQAAFNPPELSSWEVDGLAVRRDFAAGHRQGSGEGAGGAPFKGECPVRLDRDASDLVVHIRERPEVF